VAQSSTLRGVAVEATVEDEKDVADVEQLAAVPLTATNQYG
jgi:hypothetical protein